MQKWEGGGARDGGAAEGQKEERWGKWGGRGEAEKGQGVGGQQEKGGGGGRRPKNQVK